MLLRRIKDPNLLVRIGIFALALASIASYVVQRKSGIPESIADPVVGFVYGVAIATTLLGVHRRARSRKG